MIAIFIGKTYDEQNRSFFMGTKDDYLSNAVMSSKMYPDYNCIELSIELAKEYRDFLNKSIESYEKDTKAINQTTDKEQISITRLCNVCAPGLLNEAMAQVLISKGEKLICPACKGTGRLP